MNGSVPSYLSDLFMRPSDIHALAVMLITIGTSYTVDGASHTVGRRKLKPDRRHWLFPRS